MSNKFYVGAMMLYMGYTPRTPDEIIASEGRTNYETD